MPDGPGSVADGEHVLRRFPGLPDQFRDGRPTSGIFRTPGDRRSVFVEERLAGGPGDIEVERFATWGRARLSVAAVRQVRFMSSGEEVTPFDTVLDPDGTRPPLDHCRDAHALLTGPHSTAACRALLAAVLATDGIVKHPALAS